MSLKDWLFETEAQSSELPCTPDQAFGLLKNSRRRHILDTLHDTGRAELGDMAVAIAMIEGGHEHADAVPRKERKARYVSLYQSHFPKIADTGVATLDDHGHELVAACDLTPLIEAMRGIETATGGA